MLNFADLQALGLDTEEGLAYCADDPEFYEEMLEEYVSEAQGRINELKKFYEEEDWKRYGILAHSLKSTSRMIGAQKLSELARELEMAAKEGAFDTLSSLHQPFLAAYTELTREIGARF